MSVAPIVSVITPTFRRAHFVGRAISSVLAQTFQDFELIVIDDASPDNTGEVVKAFTDPRVRYIRLASNGGVSRARNTGIKNATNSEFLAYLDDDDEWYPEKLEKQLNVFRAGPPNLGVVGCGLTVRDLKGADTYIPARKGEVFEDLLARRAKGFAANLVLVRRSSPDLLYDESLTCLEDAEYMFRLAQQWHFDFVPEVLVRIRRDDHGEHLWNPANALVGHLKVLELYADALKARPRVHAYYCICIGRELWALGRTEESRRWFLQAAELMPNPRVSAWAAATRLGPLGLRMMSKLAPLRPPAA